MGSCNSSKKNHGINDPKHKQPTPDLNKKPLKPKRRNIMRNQTIRIKTEEFIIANSKKIRNEYNIQNKIGSGSYGEVRKAIHLKTKQLRAIKIINKSK